MILSCNEQVELRASLENHNAFRYDLYSVITSDFLKKMVIIFSKVLEAMKRHSDDAQLLRKAILSLASLSATGEYMLMIFSV